MLPLPSPIIALVLYILAVQAHFASHFTPAMAQGVEAVMPNSYAVYEQPLRLSYQMVRPGPGFQSLRVLCQ